MATLSAAGAAPEASAAPRVPTSASASATPKSAYAGTWAGGYEARKAPIALPSADPWPAWQHEDGTRTGHGELEISVDAAGFVSGRATGPLGPQQLRGRVEDGKMRAGVTPSPGQDAEAGALTAAADGDLFRGVMRVSGPDGEQVRVADVSLHRKP